MTGDTSELTIERLTSSWLEHGIRPNPEYQRGSTWGIRQKQLLVDSIFRGYPLPRFYFEIKVSRNFLGQEQPSLEVIDGQQRLIAMSEFVADNWSTLDVGDPKVPLPPSIRSADAPWSGKRFSQLSSELQERFLAVPQSVVLITADESDEVRDLFIRLQSGTPLTVQQVRDAWPGNVGPFIERLAGKGQQIGQFNELFSVVDRRGGGGISDDEYDDPSLDARQTCAQLLLVFLALEKGRSYPSLRSGPLNDLYHENTDFDPKGRSAHTFEVLLGDVEAVLKLRPDEPAKGRKKRKKVTKSQLISLFLFMRLLRHSPIEVRRATSEIAGQFWGELPEGVEEPRGRVSGADTMETHFTWFVQTRMAALRLPELDSRRLFAEDQKDEIWRLAGGACGECGQPVERGEAEYDHITPWILGGRTEIGNGRPVHGPCHPRGLAAVNGRQTPVEV